MEVLRQVGVTCLQYKDEVESAILACTKNTEEYCLFSDDVRLALISYKRVDSIKHILDALRKTYANEIRRILSESETLVLCTLLNTIADLLDISSKVERNIFLANVLERVKNDDNKYDEVYFKAHHIIDAIKRIRVKKRTPRI